MIEDVVASLVSIESALQNLGRTVLLRSLQPGLSAEAVQGALVKAGLTASPELELVYGWRNGTSTARVAAVDDIHLFPGFYFLSLEDAIANYRAFVADSRWSKGWLPIFANGGGDFYVVDLTSAAASSVRHFRIDESEHPVEFSSLAAMLMTLAQAFSDEVFFVDSSGYLEMDDRVFGNLAAELNPDVDWWRG